MRIMVTQIIMRLKGLFVDDVGLVEMFNGAVKLSQTTIIAVGCLTFVESMLTYLLIFVSNTIF